MIPHATYLADRPPIFSAPFATLLAGLVSDVPRYERDKRLCGTPRKIRSAPGATQGAAESLQSKILDVLKAAPLVLEAIERRRMDSGAVAIAIDGKRSTVYESLHRMIDDGRVVEIDVGKLRGHGQRCIEFAAAQGEHK